MTPATLLQDAPTARPGRAISRRRFIELCGGGIVVLVGMAPLTARAQAGRSIYPEVTFSRTKPLHDLPSLQVVSIAMKSISY